MSPVALAGDSTNNLLRRRIRIGFCGLEFKFLFGWHAHRSGWAWAGDVECLIMPTQSRGHATHLFVLGYDTKFAFDSSVGVPLRSARVSLSETVSISSVADSSTSSTKRLITLLK